MRKSIVGVVLLALLGVGGCSTTRHLDRYAPIAEAFLRAAESGDSAALRRICADTLAAQGAEVLWKLKPGLVRSALRGLKLRGGGVSHDTADVFFTPRGNPAEPLAFTFIKRGGRWLVLFAGLANDTEQ